MEPKDDDSDAAEGGEAEIDWNEVARKALGSAVVGALLSAALRALTEIAESERKRGKRRHAERDAPAAPTDGDDDAGELSEAEYAAGQAAAMLGVSVDACEDEIRATLRERLTRDRLHPDQGGDPEQAKCLIAAQNLLIQRARERDSVRP